MEFKSQSFWTLDFSKDALKASPRAGLEVSPSQRITDCGS